MAEDRGRGRERAAGERLMDKGKRKINKGGKVSKAVLLSIFKARGRCERAARKTKNFTPFLLGLTCKILFFFH